MLAKASAADWLPGAASVLARADPWALAISQTRERRPQESLARLLLQENALGAFRVFRANSGQLRPDHLSRLLAILPKGPESAHNWWRAGLEIGEALGKHAQPSDYANLITLFGRAERRREIERVWALCEEKGMLTDINLWNQYIQATCDVDPAFWPWPRRNTFSFAGGVAEKRLAYGKLHFNNMAELLVRMIDHKVEMNKRTMELSLLWTGRQGRLDKARELAMHVLNLSREGGSSQGDSAACAVMETFGFNKRPAEGYAMCARIVDLKKAYPHFWTRTLRLGATFDPPLVDQVWEDMQTEYEVPFDPGVYWIRLEFLDSKCRFEEMIALGADLAELAKSDKKAKEIFTSAINRAVTGLSNTYSMHIAQDRLRELDEKGIAVPQESVLLLNQLIDEDDDDGMFPVSC